MFCCSLNYRFNSTLDFLQNLLIAVKVTEDLNTLSGGKILLFLFINTPADLDIIPENVFHNIFFCEKFSEKIIIANAISSGLFLQIRSCQPLKAENMKISFYVWNEWRN